MNVYNDVGNLAYSTSDVTWNQVDFFYVPPNGSASNSYPTLSGRESLLVQMFINPPPSDRKALAHSMSVSGTTVSVSGGSEAAYILVLVR
jgi:hypothetical protein